MLCGIFYYYFAFFLENGYRNLVRLFDVISVNAENFNGGRQSFYKINFALGKSVCGFYYEFVFLLRSVFRLRLADKFYIVFAARLKRKIIPRVFVVKNYSVRSDDNFGRSRDVFNAFYLLYRSRGFTRKARIKS